MKQLEQINELIVFGEPFCLATVLNSARNDIAPDRQIIVRRNGSLEGATGNIDMDGLIVRIVLFRFEQRC